MGEQWSWLDRARTATWWRPWKLRQAEVAPRMTGVLSWQNPRWALCLQVLAEPPRRRQLPRLPQEVILGFARSDPSLQPAPPQAIAACSRLNLAPMRLTGRARGEPEERALQ